MPSLTHQKRNRPLAAPYKSSGPPSSTTSTSSTSTISSKSPKKNKKSKILPPLSRNIDEVVFASHSIKTWYPSWYPKEILGEKTLALAEEGKGTGIVVKTLYVCRVCFKYSLDGRAWKRHQDLCEREGIVRGREVYRKGGWDTDMGEEGRWSVWEVDGGREKIFCQNLSLFAKLFLDTKSVFFDVETFKYYIYIHTSPSTGLSQIIGYFSKEKMSWDHNNLACILVFPPWQKKGLGTNLIGLSYSIARREKIMGGPEKPISVLGMKSYSRYWGAEIARFLLQDFEDKSKEYLGSKEKGKEMVGLTIADISRGTWIAPEDVLWMMRKMDLVKVDKEGGTVLQLECLEAWLARTGISVERVVDEDGFVEGFAEKVEDEEE